MQDLNELAFFAAVVSHGGFAAAGRALGLPKSKLSRRVAQLETRLGIRLIERSSRHFRVTDIGKAFFERCRSVLAELESAEALVAEAHGVPRGLVRFACPTGLIEPLNPALRDYLVVHPQVRLQVIASNRRIDLIEERVDLALRVRTSLDSDAALTMRTLGRSRRVLLASPALAERLAGLGDVAEIARAPTLSSVEGAMHDQWQLVGPAGMSRTILHEPRLASSDFGLLREAAMAGIGIALLPDHICWQAMQDGRLVQLWPDWYAQEGVIHLVFTARRGLPPAVRALIDALATFFRSEQQQARLTGMPALSLSPPLRRL
ncbi:LysR family transcriptional regulator [Hyphomicrobiales bacterium]|nr:LysR family transcriptional regulator [Hyphomicrobiales bacterium]CAH1700897.1 LysR family transcriptional regulator [Hyphomicrobiales bacterium]CAI0344773.1 LysR family transcriptional regulator [Hyphomicrobiales bacterium]